MLSAQPCSTRRYPHVVPLLMLIVPHVQRLVIRHVAVWRAFNP
jgi:hypothetical protein